MLNLPNILTISRIFVIPLVIALFYWDSTATRWATCLLFTAAGITDFFDGYLARRAKQVSRFGRFLDPIADKLLVAAVILYLASSGRMNLIETLPGVVILLREILVSGLREFLAELRVGLPVTKLAKYKTTAQMFALGFLIVGDRAPESIPARDIGDVLMWGAAILTLVTGYDYLKAGLAHMANDPTGRMMTVLYFAWVKEKVGLSEETVTPPAEIATVADLIGWLKARGPGHAAAFTDSKLVKAAVDQVHAPLSASIVGVREVAFFPPVTGG